MNQPLRKWVNWCSGKQIDPFLCDINPILEFFCELFQARYEYKPTGTHRSAISLYHDLLDKAKDNIRQKVFGLMQGFFITRTSQLKHILNGMFKRFLNFIKQTIKIKNDKKTFFKINNANGIDSISDSN